ncbi:MAG TPA: hypothetical protein V6C76_12770 [Drouetiella sp.]
MELRSQERMIISRESAKRKFVGCAIIYMAMVPAPLLLMGKPVWAFFACIVFVTFAYVCPAFFAPTKRELDRLMHYDSRDQSACDDPLGAFYGPDSH